MIERGLRAAAAALVVLWCGIGVVETVDKLTGPLGWYSVATRDSQGMVSLPRADSTGMTPIGEMWANPIASHLSPLHIVAATVAAFAGLWLLGALALLPAGVVEPGGADALVTQLACGVGILAILGTTLCIAGLPLSPWPVYGLGMVLAARNRGRLRAMAPSVSFPRDRVARGMLGLAFILLLLVAAAATRDRLWSDGRFMWAFKGHVLFLEGVFPRWLLDEARFPTPDYPLAVPLLDWWIFRHAGRAAGSLASLAGAIWLALVAILLWAALQRKTDEQTAAAGTLAVAAFWPLGYYATGGTADIVIALALLGTVVELERAFVGRDRGAMFRAGVFLTLGAMSKNEGIALAAVAAMVGGTLLLWQRRSLRQLLPLVTPLVLAVPWFFFTRSFGVQSPAIANEIAASTAVTRMPFFLDAVSRHLFSAPWLPASLLAICGALGMMCRRSPALASVWAVLGGYGAAVTAIYLQVPADFAWLLQTSLARVLAVMIPATVFLSLITVASKEARHTLMVDGGRSSHTDTQPWPRRR